MSSGRMMEPRSVPCAICKILILVPALPEPYGPVSGFIPDRGFVCQRCAIEAGHRTIPDGKLSFYDLGARRPTFLDIRGLQGCLETISGDDSYNLKSQNFTYQGNSSKT